MEYPTKRLYTDLGIDTLEVSRKKSTLNMVYQGLNDLLPPQLNSLFNEYIPARSLRSEANHLIRIPATKLKTSEIDNAVCGSRYWNPIDIELKTCPNLNQFKGNLKKCDARKLHSI